MGKSAKKRKHGAKRNNNLDKFRGCSLLDTVSPGYSDTSSAIQSKKGSDKTAKNKSKSKNYSLETSTGHQELVATTTTTSRLSTGTTSTATASTTTEATQQLAPKDSLTFSHSASYKRIEFVLPRADGAKPYIFEQARTVSDKAATKEAVQESKGLDKKRHTPGETIDDILSPSKKRRLDTKFEAIHREEEDEKHGPMPQKAKNVTTDPNNEEGNDNETVNSNNNLPQQVTLESPTSINHTTSDLTKSTKGSPTDSPTASTGSRITQRTFESPSSGKISGLSVEEAVRDKGGLRPRANSTDGELNLPQRGLCDEWMILQTHKWQDELNYVHQTSPKGFINLGNTCFLNATLQCLAYLPPFCQSLITIADSKTKNDKRNKKLPPGQKITSILSSLFQRIHEASYHEQSIAPNAIVKALPSIGSCGSRHGYKFRPGRQEDAHEFLVHLLEAMHDGELRAAGINQHASGWRDRLPVRRLDETTFVHRIFGGYFRSQVRCGKCGYRSNTYDPFLDLSLEVSKKSSNSVLFALSEFTRKETLDSANQWKCSGCKKYVCATKQLTVFRPPLSLCIQLKRFTFGGGFGGRGFSSFGSGGWKYGKNKSFSRGGAKITKPIEFPSDLDLPLSDGRSCAYTLMGIVIHVGGSASSGHYTAYVKRPSRKGSNQWFHADDSYVEPVSERTVLRQRDAYLLFYCRKEVKLEFPAPPPRDMSDDEAKEYGRARARARADSNSRDETKGLVDGAANEETDVARPKTQKKQELNNKHAAQLDGKMPRTKTTIHPLATPARLSQAFAGEQKPITATEKNRTDIANVTTVSSSQLREYMMSNGHPSPSPISHASSRGGSPVDHMVDTGEGGNFAASLGPVPVPSPAQKDSESERQPQSQILTNGNLSPALGEGVGRNNKLSLPNGGDEEGTVRKPSLESPVPTKSNNDDTSDKANFKNGKKDIPLPAVADESSSSDDDSSDDDSSSDDSSSDDDKEQSKQLEPKRGNASVSSDTSKSRQSTGKPNNHVKDDDDGDGDKNKKVDGEKANGKGRKKSQPRMVVSGESMSGSVGKVKATIGKKQRKTLWRPKVVSAANISRSLSADNDGNSSDKKSRSGAFALLGNLKVSTWDDDVDVGPDDKSRRSSNSKSGLNANLESRSKIVAKMERDEKSRKRKMHLDRWDSILDQGKKKKVRQNAIDQSNSKDKSGKQNSQNNVFQRIQSGLQRMGRGRAKGLLRRNRRKSSF